MCLLIWTVFSGEWCGPWASCFVYWFVVLVLDHIMDKKLMHFLLVICRKKLQFIFILKFRNLLKHYLRNVSYFPIEGFPHFFYTVDSLWYLYLLHTSVPVYVYSIPACSILKCCEIVTPSAFSLYLFMFMPFYGWLFNLWSCEGC